MMSDRIRTGLAYLIGMGMVMAVAAAPTVAQKTDENAERVFKVAGTNVDKVDGQDAVKYTTNRVKRAGKLVATNAAGVLPSNIVKPQWRVIQNMPPIFRDGQIAWSEVTDKPTVPGGSVAWPDVTGKPATLADGVVGWGEVQNKPGILDDRMVGWGEVQNIPTGFADRVDDVGVAGVKVEFVSNEASIPAGDARSVTAQCPAGSVVVGGGFHRGWNGNVQVVESAPVASVSWQVSAYNPDALSRDVDVYAVCMTASK